MINPISDLNGIKVPLVYPSRLSTPWPAYKHYASSRIEEKSLDYVIKTYKLSGAKEEEFKRSKISDYICMVFPDGTEEQLELLSKHVACFGILDDIVDQPDQLGTKHEDAIKIFADIELALDESKVHELNDFSSPFGKEHAVLYRQFLDLDFPDEARNLYKNGFLKYKIGSLKQIQHRNTFWRNITVREYINIRRDESGIPWYFQFIEWTNGVCLPNHIWNSEEFQKLIRLTSDFIGYANDAASYAKEYCSRDFSNIITVLLNNYPNLTTQDALYVLAHLSKLVLKEFENTVKKLMEFKTPNKLRNDLDRVILAARKHISGYCLWNSDTSKYKFYAEKDVLHDISLPRIDVTNTQIRKKFRKIAKNIFKHTYKTRKINCVSTIFCIRNSINCC